MKYLFIFIIKVYQFAISPLIPIIAGPFAGCRFEKSCSEYAIESINNHGAAMGALMSVKRIAKCQPFYK